MHSIRDKDYATVLDTIVLTLNIHSHPWCDFNYSHRRLHVLLSSHASLQVSQTFNRHSPSVSTFSIMLWRLSGASLYLLEFSQQHKFTSRDWCLLNLTCDVTQENRSSWEEWGWPAVELDCAKWIQQFFKKFILQTFNLFVLWSKTRGRSYWHQQKIFQNTSVPVKIEFIFVSQWSIFNWRPNDCASVIAMSWIIHCTWPHV